MSNARKLADGIKSSANATAIHIDSSENVMIGKTDSSIATQGVFFNPNYSHITSTNDTPLALSRKSSDGVVLDIRKDGTQKGTIDVASDSVTYKTGQAQFNKGGYYSPAPFHEKNLHFFEGHRYNLGFFGPSSAIYLHIKLNLPDNGNKMVKFEYNGFEYSGTNVHNSVTFYTYSGTNSPYNPTKQEWGNGSSGIVNYYYSSDNKVVIVLKSSGSYTGGFLYVQSGRSHMYTDPDVLATSSSSSNSGVY